MAKILCVLYDDPIDGYPSGYARDDLPAIKNYPDGQTLPTPAAVDFQAGALLGCVSGELGLREFLEAGGHQLVVTSDKDGADSEFDRELVDAVRATAALPAYGAPRREPPQARDDVSPGAVLRCPSGHSGPPPRPRPHGCRHAGFP